MGLSPPATVLEATDDYFKEQDTVGQWIEDCIRDAEQPAFTRLAELFASWRYWCEERNLKPGSTVALSGALADRGYEKQREAGTGQRGFSKIAIRRK